MLFEKILFPCFEIPRRFWGTRRYRPYSRDDKAS